MTFSVHVRADAERDMVRAQDWYAVEAPAQVERFAEELAAAIEAPQVWCRIFVSGWDANHAEAEVRSAGRLLGL